MRFVTACERPLTQQPTEVGLKAVWSVKHTHFFGGRAKDAWEFYGSSKQRYYEWKRCLEPNSLIADAALSTLLPDAEAIGQQVEGDLLVSGIVRASGFETSLQGVEEAVSSGCDDIVYGSVVDSVKPTNSPFIAQLWSLRDSYHVNNTNQVEQRTQQFVDQFIGLVKKKCITLAKAGKTDFDYNGEQCNPFTGLEFDRITNLDRVSRLSKLGLEDIGLTVKSCSIKFSSGDGFQISAHLHCKVSVSWVRPKGC